ncbi:MAG: hypothetical protein IJW25_02255, partial [Clostridia bacterium]|nr:hypothetical protein [Clostridia bacterium]
MFNTKSVYAHSEVKSWNNLNFSSNNNLSNVYTNPTGWTLGVSEAKTTSGAINLDKFNDSFYLDADEVPEKLSDSADDHILMINSESATSKLPAYQYYTNSSSLSLDAYSNYKVVVWTKVLQGSRASIYITGLENNLGFENINANVAGEWTSFTFYISTGSETESIKTELWLGAKPTTTSNGAVFFDNLSVLKLSSDLTPNAETAKENLVSTPTSHNDNVKYVNLNESVVLENFESGTSLSKWSKTMSQMKNGTYAELLDLSTPNISTSKGLTYVGTDLSKNNKTALALYTEEGVKSYFGLKSEAININLYETFKVSVNVKVADLSGNAYVKFVEQDVRFGQADPNNADSNIVETITPKTEQISISSNASNKFQNNYTTCTFYVKGRSLYQTSYRIELWLGSSESEASGLAVFDNIIVENISNSEYENAKTDSTTIKVSLQGEDGDYGIDNATFNAVKKAEKDLTYPLIPENWTHKVSDKEDVFFGVVNTYDKVYEATKAQFGGFANPGNPQGFLSVDKDTNNILLMHNYNKAYQSVTSSEFSVEANKYYKLSFDFKQLTNTPILNVYVQDENASVLYADENIESQNPQTWEKYNIYVSTNSYTSKLKVVISLGTQENQVTGIAYLDNVTLTEDTSLTKELYEALSEESNVLDFQEGNFNLIKDNGSNIYEPLRYTGSLETGEGSNIALGGIIDGNDDEDEFNIENSENNQNSLKYMMMIQTHGKSTYSFTAK